MSALSIQHNAINLGQGFPNFDCDPRLRELITKYLNQGKNQYAPSAGVMELRKAISDKIRRCFDKEVDPNSEITITAGATQAIYSIINAFMHRKDEVIVIEPAYDSYRPSIEMAGGVVVPYRLEGPEFTIDWQVMSDLINDRTKMIIINTPHNPTGTILSSDDLVALSRLISDKNIILLSDEVYEHLIYDEARHESVMRYPDLYEQCIAVYSFGKTFHSTGWKIGYCVGPERLMTEVRRQHQWIVFSVNSFLQYALAEYLADPDTYESLPSFYQKKRDFFNDSIHGSSLLPYKSAGTYFQLFDYSAISSESDVDFAVRMTTEYGVASIPISVFYSNGMDNKVIRLCYAKTEDLLEKAGSLLRKL